MKDHDYVNSVPIGRSVWVSGDTLALLNELDVDFQYMYACNFGRYDHTRAGHIICIDLKLFDLYKMWMNDGPGVIDPREEDSGLFGMTMAEFFRKALS